MADKATRPAKNAIVCRDEAGVQGLRRGHDKAVGWIGMEILEGGRRNCDVSVQWNFVNAKSNNTESPFRWRKTEA